ncbi:MAG: Zn-dependent hydrolase [Bacteroidetes bacterium]|nr:Zn-dependent hydrolase [Bacteroidota bacterium]MBU1717502.1 Zn-dependent hydrolase [Bacteroidota bacterium]
MKKLIFTPFCLIISAVILTSCGSGGKDDSSNQNDTVKVVQVDPMEAKVKQFAEFTLTSDMSVLTEKEKQMIPILLEVAEIMDNLYWRQTIGNKDEFLAGITDEKVKKFAEINYGPWERLKNNEPFISTYGEKPKGAQFYPADMTVEEFEAFDDPDKKSQYTFIRRGDDGKLKCVWFHEEFKEEIEKAAQLIEQAAGLAEDAGLKKYLKLRAKGLRSDNYFESDMTWMEMKTNTIDFVVGPTENYEDALFGYKTSYESFVLVKDKKWSEKLEKFAALLPELQKQLPVADEYKKEIPGADSDLNAYDAVYYAGDCNAGSKTIAINLPNDEKVQAKKGSRKLQLKNSMRAKFENILMPIASMLIVPEQRKYITFNAFFENTMFHEVAHGLGIKNTINGKGFVKESLKETYSSLEEGKADILGLFLVTKLYEMGELTEGQVIDNYITFFAGIFRSVRFGAASAHGKANMMRFAYFQEHDVFTRTEDGTYRVDFEKMKAAVSSLGEKILIIQGNGDYEAAKKWIEEKGNVSQQLQDDLDRLGKADIPVDIVFNQGKAVLGL